MGYKFTPNGISLLHLFVFVACGGNWNKWRNAMTVSMWECIYIRMGWFLGNGFFFACTFSFSFYGQMLMILFSLLMEWDFLLHCKCWLKNFAWNFTFFENKWFLWFWISIYSFCWCCWMDFCIFFWVEKFPF